MFGHPRYFFALPDRDELITFPVLKSPFKATVDIIFYFPWLEGVRLLLVQSHFYVLPEMKWLKRTPLGSARGLRKNIILLVKPKKHHTDHWGPRVELLWLLLCLLHVLLWHPHMPGAPAGAGICWSHPEMVLKLHISASCVCFVCLWGIIFLHLWEDSAVLNLQHYKMEICKCLKV